jgi:hypothetical protein
VHTHLLSAAVSMTAIQMGLADCDLARQLLSAFFWFSLLQTPWYIIKWFAGLIRSLWLLWFATEPTAADVVLILESTLLVLLSKPNMQPGQLVIDIPSIKLRFQAKAGQRPQEMKSIEVVYTTGSPTEEATIVSFKLNGKLVATPQQMLSALVNYHVTSFHTKSHLFSNALVRHIAGSKSLSTLLKDSTFGSVPLHNALVRSPRGVIKAREQSPWLLYNLDVVHESIIFDESTNMSALVGHSHFFPEAVAERVKRSAAAAAAAAASSLISRKSSTTAMLLKPAEAPANR